MSGMSRPAAAKEPEETLLAAPERDVAVTATALALTAVVFALVADHRMPAHIQRPDDARLRLMVSGRSAPITAVVKFFNLLRLVYVTLPARIAIAGFLALRRRWRHLAAFAAAVVHIAGCKYRNLTEPGPGRQNGRVYSAGFFEDRRRYPRQSLSKGLLAGGGGSGRGSPGRGVSGAGQADRCARGGTPGAGPGGRVAHA